MFLVSADKLIGDVIQIIANDLRLRADSQDVIADPLDQRCFPAGRYGAERVPCMASDKAELRGANPQLLLDVGVNLARRLVLLDAVHAEPPLEKANDTGLLKLTSLNLR